MAIHYDQGNEMNWQPINTYPGYKPDLTEEDDEYWDYKFEWGVLVGTVLRKKAGDITLIGHDINGYMTSGCACCATYWLDEIKEYTEWAWVPGFEDA